MLQDHILGGGCPQGPAGRTVDVSSTVKGQGGALGGPALLWNVNSQAELGGSPQIHGVSIQYLTQITKMVGKNPSPPRRAPNLQRLDLASLWTLCFDELAVCLGGSTWSEVHKTQNVCTSLLLQRWLGPVQFSCMGRDNHFSTGNGWGETWLMQMQRINFAR